MDRLFKGDCRHLLPYLPKVPTVVLTAPSTSEELGYGKSEFSNSTGNYAAIDVIGGSLRHQAAETCDPVNLISATNDHYEHRPSCLDGCLQPAWVLSISSRND